MADVKKTLVDYMSEEDYTRYNELISLAETAKANAPKAERKPRGPMTIEQKKKAADFVSGPSRYVVRWRRRPGRHPCRFSCSAAAPVQKS